jgi:hypothetical protein
MSSAPGSLTGFGHASAPHAPGRLYTGLRVPAAAATMADAVIAPQADTSTEAVSA